MLEEIDSLKSWPLNTVVEVIRTRWVSGHTWVIGLTMWRLVGGKQAKSKLCNVGYGCRMEIVIDLLISFNEIMSSVPRILGVNRISSGLFY